jgi:hypothetical protein
MSEQTPSAEIDALSVVRDLLAQAWEEGYQARRGEGWQSPGADNPYRVTLSGAFAENCLPSGCSCGCHNPTYGLHYSHMVPCCATSQTPAPRRGLSAPSHAPRGETTEEEA